MIMETTDVVINDCIVTSFEVTQPFQDIEYTIGFPAITETIIPFTMEPQCGYDIVYTINEVSGSNQLRELPSFMIFDEPDVFEVESFDETDSDEYIIQVTGAIEDGPQAETQAFFRFTLLASSLPAAVFSNTPPIFVTDPTPIVFATQG